MQIDNSSNEEEASTGAAKGVQTNMINLSQQFEVDIKGCREEALELLMKLDQKREGKNDGEDSAISSPKSTIPNEIRNLFFGVNFKNGEPRTRGRILTLTHQ